MLRVVPRVLTVIVFICALAGRAHCAEPAAAPAAPFSVSASAAVLMDLETGKVLFAKAARQRRPMASTTKIMTALLIAEKAKPGRMVTVSEHALKTKSASLWVKAGQQLKMGDVLKAILLNSSNDACVAAAEAVCGSERRFVGLMNRRAKRMGALDTHFANSNGLHAPDHYSSAYDLALITRSALRQQAVNVLVGTRKARAPWPGKAWDKVLENHNKLLWMVPGADGVKTGYVKESGKCLVASATRGGWRLQAVVLNSEDVWGDAKRLLEAGFRDYRLVRAARQGQAVGRAPVRGGRVGRAAIAAAEPISVVVRKGMERSCRFESKMRLPLRAPLEKGQRVGEGILLLNGVEVARGDLLVGEDVELSWPLTAWLWLKRLAGAVLALFLLALCVRTGAKAVRARSRAKRM